MNAINLKKIDDNQLVNLYQQGSKSAMGELYSRYYSLVYAKCFSFAKNVDDAEDLAQDVMIRVMDKLDSFKGDSKFSTWLYSITFNYCTDNFRKKKKKISQPLEVNYDLVDNSEDSHQEQIELSAKEHNAIMALENLSIDDKELLTLKYTMNLSIEELQQKYALSASAVKMRLMRARSKATEIYRTSMVIPAA